MKDKKINTYTYYNYFSSNINLNGYILYVWGSEYKI